MYIYIHISTYVYIILGQTLALMSRETWREKKKKKKHLPGSEKDVGVSLFPPYKSTVCPVIAKLGQM